MIARSLRNKILWSTFVQYFGKVLQIVLGVFIIKLGTNALGLEDYSFFRKVEEYALFFSVAANLGIFGNVLRKMSTAPEDGKLFVNSIILRIGSIVCFFTAGMAYSIFFVQDPQFSLGLLFLFSALFFDSISSVCTAALQANYLMGRSVFAMTIGRCMEFAAILILIHLSAPVHFYFLAPLASAFIALLLSLFFVSQKITLKWALNWSLQKELLLTSLPFGIINIINNLYYRFIPSLFAAKALSEVQFGSYGLMLSATGTIAIFSTFLMLSTLPIFKQSLKEKKFKRARELYSKTRYGLATLGLLGIISGSILGPMLLKLVSNQSFLDPAFAFTLPLLLTLMALSYLYDLVLITLFGLEDEVWFLKNEVLALAIASLFFISSLYLEPASTKLLLILCGAIAGEGTMVALGMRRVTRIFQKES